jgi:dolichyl-phosphate-mannose--protein O-mannosyl transferase
MKKIQRILAVIGILLLVSLYVATLVLALTDDPATMDLFRASIYCTVIVPVLIWAYSFIYKLLKNNYGDKKTED